MNTSESFVSDRLASLDILRGFDLFLLVFFQPVLVALGEQLDFAWLNAVLYQFDHELWVGFRCWDLVMPLFLFMTGAAMPFSFAKFARLSDKSMVYRKFAKRFVLLFLFGMVVQGNLLGLDPGRLYLYSNTLQAIAVGYLIAAFILLHLSFKWQIGATLLLLLVYWLPMTFLGDFTPEGNFADKVDRLILGRFRDGAYCDADGYLHFSPNYTYTWIWSSLTFGVTVMLGTFAGKIMKDGGENRRRVVKMLLLTGVGLIGIALLWSLQMPIIKRLWTCSMTLFSGGICFLLMGLFYYWIDYKRRTYGLDWLKIYGMNSITAYLLGETVNFRSVAASVSYGLEQYLGNYYSVWLTFANFLILFFILRTMYRHGVFLKL
ncbi:acyltransferase family protein [Bacteroides heparinolyticus]|uniref:acyltransferase family protein n=1 Tax=Prevotella heparinolytica TaxID=28113 RepID=UPI003AF0A623